MLILLTFSFLAGLATVLSPCILPILPIMLSGSIGGKYRPYGIISGFVISFTVITLFLGFLIQRIGLNLDTMRIIAAIILTILGLLLVFPQFKNHITKYLPQIKTASTKNQKGFMGGFFAGLTLGLIWTPCAGPILAAVITLAATTGATFTSFLIVLSYSLGTSAVMILIILGSKKLIQKISLLNKHLDTIQKIFGVLIVLTAIALFTGFDRELQSLILDITPEGWHEFLISFENNESISKQLNKLD